MPLTQCNLNVNLSWQQAVLNVYNTNTVEGPDSLSFSLANLNLTTFNQIFAEVYVIAASASVTIDLSTLTNLVKESFGFQHVLSMAIKTTGGEITFKPGASNGFVYNFTETTPAWTIHSGGVFCVSEASTATGVVVDSTHKNITLTNNGGTSSTVSIVVVGSTT